jgi:hypothetical protein
MKTRKNKRHRSRRKAKITHGKPAFVLQKAQAIRRIEHALGIRL